ncbi:MAG TPA: Ig-like domain-containing protein, partial [Candidatus Paceibacterota bacterium]|nr:Ig-like domain-containing protein [Candidatus Paceibacterota bacterium]
GYSESGSGTCAKVKLVLNQEAVISRDAFNATLQVINGSDSQLQDVSVELKIVSTNGVSSIGAFGIRPPTLVSLSAVDGTGLIDPQTTGEASWIIIPGSDAAPEAPTVYYVSGTLKYSQDGLLVTVPLAAVPITVYPNPKLYIKYFHQRDVYADDPFTTEFEPSIPFNLAVMVENRGKGTARNMRITSSQPKIVENDKGLLIDFQIIGTEVAGQNTTPSLTVNFGNIGPSGIAIGRWLMTSTLQGLFEDYKATFENVDDLGNKKLSLIDEVTIHEMIHLVQAPGSFEDGKPDFLVNDVFDTRDLPDTLYLSDGTTNPVSVAEESIVDAPPSASHPEVQLTAPMQAGWTYLRVPEPGDGQYQLTRVVRSDGVEIYFNTNAWTTDRTFIGMGRKPVRENILHLLDYNSTGVYTLYYGTPPAADTNAPASSVVALPAKSSPTFVVQWSATDDGGVAGCDLYVSTNGGPFGLWLSNTKLVSTLFTGAYGSTYSFYSVARDYAGNTEPAPALPDAITRVTPTIIAVADALGIKQDKTTVASAVKLLANDTDSAGSPLSVTGVISPSANGGSVSLSGGLIRYTPP